MELVKCDKCHTTYTSNFCPDCGQSRDDIKKVLPIYVDTFTHSRQTGEDLEELELNIDPESKLAENYYYLNYEVGLTYEIVKDNFELKQVQIGTKLFDVVETKTELR